MESCHQPLLNEDLLKFPCRFEIKVLGRKSSEFEEHISAIVNRHLSGASILGKRFRCSRQGRYISVTCMFRAVSREQLDAIYLDLNSEPGVLMTL